MKTLLNSFKIQTIFLGFLLMIPQALFALSGFSATSDADNLFYSFNFTGSPSFLHVFLDTDKNATTGYSIKGIGAEYMIENQMLYRFSGASRTSWGWKAVTSSNMTKSSSNIKWKIARAVVGNPAAINALANTSAGDSSTVVSQNLSLAPAPAPSPTPTPTPSPAPVGSTTSVSFTANNSLISNPERGFFWMTDCRANPKSVAQLQAYRSQNGHTILHCMWYLRDFKNAPISSTVLTQLQTQMNNVRAAGFKMILRFAYTNTDINDAPLSVVLGHLDQLAPYLQNNSDIITTVQTGLIGQWGEMSTSANFGGPSSATDWANRKTVIDKLLSVVPSSRQVAVRTPQFKMQPYGGTPLTDAEAFTGTSRARVTHYNDCFMSSANDYGTYLSSADKPFLIQDSKYLAMSGETCAVSTYNDCDKALNEMSQLHWSLLHEGYNTAVYDKWKTQGCFQTVQSRLGYRLQLQTATLSTTAKVGGSIQVALNIVNTGFAALYNERPVQLILRNASTGALIRLQLNSDPRRWLPGSTISLNQTLVLPANIPAGTYALMLALPDAASGLANRPEYSIQLANTGIWEAATGFNNLKVNLVVSQ